MYSQINENNEQDGRRLLAECEEIAKKHDVRTFPLTFPPLT